MKNFTKIIALALAIVLAFSLAACSNKGGDDSANDGKVIKIAVPNDTTNEARALLLLQEAGIIKLKDGAGITATKNDIVENPYNVEIVEAEAAAIPQLLPDVDYAVINSNYAINAGLNPVKDSLFKEGSSSAYANILAVKEGNENTDAVKALKAALESKQVADFIAEKYNGSVVSVVDDPTDGFDSSVDYAALAGTTISVAASVTPHAEILEIAKQILAEKDITLDIQTYSDYVIPNNVVEDGTVLANYFQHTPYLNSFNASNGTDLVSAAKIHYEPFGIYGNGVSDLSELQPGATIIIPADDSNETRALLLLQQEGLIKLPDDASAEKGVNHLDIVDDGGYNVTPVQADTVPSVLANSDAGTIAVINGNYALQAGLKVADALAIEDASGDAAQTYANIIAVRAGDETSEKTLALVKALQSDAVKTFIADSYNGAVVAIF